MKYYEHGDVILFPVESIKGKELNTNILMEGEVTGHKHIIEKEKTQLFMDERNVVYVEVKEPASLTHEEHGKIVIDKGYYQIGRVKQYDPFEKELKNVQD
jgi:hypothetical protein